MANLTLRTTKGSPLTNAEVDANFTNINTEVGTKVTASGYTAADVLSKLLTVDGTGSGIDADLLDGLTTATANTVSTIVARDASGNFAAGTITATLTGNASTATALATARLIGGVSFDGTAAITLPGVNTSGTQNTSGTAAGLSTTLVVGSGGSGATTLTGVLKGNGTSAFSAATAGTDYLAPGPDATITAKYTHSGVLAVAPIIEKTTVSATAATGTVNFDLLTQAVVLYTTDATGNWTLNVRGNSSTTLNSTLATGDTVSIAFMVTNGSTAYYQSGFTVDGSAVTVKWQNGSAPSSGNTSSLDVYTITLTKTASATYNALGSVVKFA